MFKSLWNSLFKSSPPPAATEELVVTPGVPWARWGLVSITGNFRENNEDRSHIDAQGRFFIVADGMGGQSAGEKASEMAVELVSKRLEQLFDFKSDPADKVAAGVVETLQHANSEIMALGALDPNLHSMGTTIVMLMASGKSLYVASLGDSRVYRLRDGSFEQLTTDDSLSEALRQAGTITKEEAATHRYKHYLVRYLGSKEGASVGPPQQFPVVPGDRFLLCSDGVTDGADDATLSDILHDNVDPQSAAEAIVAAAQAGGSKDNITCVTVYVN